MRPRSRFSLLLIVTSLARSGWAAPPSAEGTWDGPGGRLELRKAADGVEGVLAAPAKDSALAAGTVVFKGSLVEDTLSGQLRLGAAVPACGAVENTGFVLLLLTRSGKLSGTFAAKEPCAKKVRSVVWVKAPPAAAAAPDAALDLPPMPPDFFDEVPPLAPIDPERETMERAQGFMGAGQHERARKLLLEVVQRQPARGEAYNGVGVTFALRNDWSSAIDWYKKGLEHQPGFGDLYFNLACAFAQSGKKPLALRYLRLAAVKGFAQPELLDDPDLTPIRAEPEFKEIKRLMAETPAAK